MTTSNTFVCLIGIGTVFVGLICIIFLCAIMSYLCRRANKEKEVEKAPAKEAPSINIPNRQEFIAAVSAALAEDLGESVSAIRILSVKRV